MSSIVFNTNTLTKAAQRSLSSSTNKIVNSTKKLSTGKRINKAGDDVASMSIAPKIDSQLRGVNKAQENITAVLGHFDLLSGGVEQSYDNLQKIRELFVQGINGTNSVEEKDAIQREIVELVRAQQFLGEETRAIMEVSPGAGSGGAPPVGFQYDGDDILNHGYYATHQIGPNDSNSELMAFSFMKEPTLVPPFELNETQIGFTTGLGALNSGTDPVNPLIVDVENYLVNFKIPGASVDALVSDDNSGAGVADNDSLAMLDTMIANVSDMNGIIQSRRKFFEEHFTKLEGEKIALNKSLSHFQDTDIAEESTALIKEQIRQQSAGSMVTQANAQAQFALSLLP